MRQSGTYRMLALSAMLATTAGNAGAFGFCSGRSQRDDVQVVSRGLAALAASARPNTQLPAESLDRVEGLLASGNAKNVEITGAMPDGQGDSVDETGLVVGSDGTYLFKSLEATSIKCESLVLNGGIRVVTGASGLEVSCESVEFSVGSAILSDGPVSIRANKLVGKPIVITLPLTGSVGENGIGGNTGGAGRNGGGGSNGKGAECFHPSDSGGDGGPGATGNNGADGLGGGVGGKGGSGAGVSISAIDGNGLTGLILISPGGDGGDGGSGGGGGDGGNGGNGGHGGSGGGASCGHDSSRGGHGGAAGNGGNAGAGGDGGDGGDGGTGGDVDLRFEKELGVLASDALSAPGAFCVDVAGGLGGHGGIGGAAGVPGSAGTPGIGGRGGNGDIFNGGASGGSGGPPGKPGRNGQPGQAGHPGENGEPGRFGQLVKRKVQPNTIPKVIFETLSF